jgi:peptidoglycan/xylan/chitin deacetylase (PgdA/CDA1 family)
MLKSLKRLARRGGITRDRVARARLYAERHALAAIKRPRPRNRGRILCYHSVGQPEMGVNDVTPKQFRSHIELALKAGMRFRPARELADTGGKPNELAITFDDGLTSLKEHAAPILKEFGILWTVFVVSAWAEQKEPWMKGFALTWKEIEALAADGVEIGSHSVTHPAFQKIGRDQTIAELEGSRHMFEQRLGFMPDAFAIPFGQSMNWPDQAAEAAKDAGYDYVYAQAEETRPKSTIARTFVTQYDHDRTFKALLGGAYDRWEEWF